MRALPPHVAKRDSIYRNPGRGRRIKLMENPASNGTSKHYLGKMVEEMEARLWLRRDCDLMVRIMFPAKGVKKVVILNGRLIDISEGGALAIIPYEQVPTYFYIILGKFQYNIGCVARKVEREYVHLEFIKTQNTNMINYLSRLDRRFDTMNELKFDFRTFQKIRQT